MRIRLAWVPFLVLFVAACDEEPTSSKLFLSPIAVTDLPGWSRDDHGEALPAWRRTCERLKSMPDDRSLGPEGIGGTVAAWRPICAVLPKRDDSAKLRKILERELLAYKAEGENGSEGLFTGYYEPELRGSRTRGGVYQVPLYGVPSNRVTVDLGAFDPELKGKRIVGRLEGSRLRPYYARADIENGALSNQAAELLWLDDALDAFILHVQGSGFVSLPNGRSMRVGFAGHNGRKYNSIGRALIERGELEKGRASWQNIRDWLEINHNRAAEVFSVNPRYIFFRELDGDGPVGAVGVVLTPGRSLAIDPSFVSLDVPLWLDAEHPIPGNGRLQRLMLTQDTGGAIKGPVRGDVFWGTGKNALAIAGRMRSKGVYYLLLPRSVAAPKLAVARATL